MEETHFSRTARVDKKAIISELHKLLMDIAQDYIIHRYFVTSGLEFWHKFTEVYSKGIMTIDYSENIQFKAKHKAQSAHFSGRQQTLHCCVIEKNGEHEYIYHLSDDKLHDSEMTFSIIEDIIKNNPSIIESGVLVLRSDNCPTQYKSRFVFARMRKLALKYQIAIFWFYGEPGHGRGLVDAMSSFGCKEPLRSAIITQDKWFDTAEEMAEYLREHFTNDYSKSFHVIHASDIANLRKQKKD